MSISRVSRRMKQRNVRSEQHQSAAIRVLSVYELLENVLKFLLPKDLRAARLVSAQWHGIIQRSQNLNQTWTLQDRYLSIAMLGDEGVGKRTLLQCWDDDYSSHNATRLSQKQISLHGELWIIDIEVMPPCLLVYEALFEQLLMSHQAYVIIYSTTSRTSFERVLMWESRVERLFSDSMKLLAIIATKQDLAQECQVDSREGGNTARMLHTQHLESSTEVAGPQEGALIPIVEQYRNTYMKHRHQSSWILTDNGPRRNDIYGNKRKRTPGALLKAIAAKVRP